MEHGVFIFSLEMTVYGIRYLSDEVEIHLLLRPFLYSKRMAEMSSRGIKLFRGIFWQ
jgi:hypothetical protein